jgi:hypothetical protein
MGESRGRGAVRAAAGTALLLVGLLALSGLTSSAAAGSDISVDVVDEQATPSPSSSVSATPAPGGTGGQGAGSSGGSGIPGNPGGTGGTTTPGDTSPAGNATVPPGEKVLLYVSGLTVTGRPSANPLAGGSVTAEVSVHNLTAETFDAEVEFHVDDVFGNELAKADSVPVVALAPDELRTIRVDLGEVRIAGLVHAYATITPPETVAAVPLAPVTRDAWSVLPSWYAVGLLVAAAISLGIGAYRRRGAL